MKRHWLIAWFAVIFAPAAFITFTTTYGQQRSNAEEKPIRDPDVIFVPTPNEVVDKMFELADVRPGEIVYDLGCGDGRIPVLAAKKYGVKAWGFDINPVRVRESLENVKKNRVEN